MSFLKNILGQKPAQEPLPSVDSDFADFAGAPSPSPVSVPSASSPLPAQPTGFRGGPVPYTKWYRVWERTQLSDFKGELILLPFLILAVLVHLWGTRTNRRKSKQWMAAHAPVLNSEFALVGYDSKSPQIEGITADNLPAELLKEKTAQDFQSYATGRQNVAWVDLQLRLFRLSNPPLMGAEWLVSLFFESYPAPRQVTEAVMYTFDGSEKKFVLPGVPGSNEGAPKPGNSAYDGFVFAIVNKTAMRHLRDERYDVSLTYTKDHTKLPAWATVMSESAEVTETMLTKELIAAIETAGEALEYLIVTDQPTDKPTKLEEAVPRKRLYLCTKVPPGSDYSSTLPLFQAFLRLPDHLAQNAHFRPEILRKLNQTREAEIKKLKRVSDEEGEEERKRLAEKVKKEERDRKMRGMTAEEQRKFLEKESDRKRKKDEKRMTRKG
ncbi:hypothetical protein EPUS_05148 [Endocarpon pusillum Z07020]|uniref:DUF1682 domain protein n=1 Tax=Endocarpon pusillum (strain Z07020 / HMAS-L-300199) TaxID=1263415 RepID=U1HW30_ENDPU|nr:uncharacterized protein EPUS_05148 [Endocarpon pusillum Z07020]ERF74940.1 hypothetical protein EPUS_05148 [Endocarpon pusillum Z07020]